MGGQGNSDLAALKKAGANIVALCDVDQKYAAKTFSQYPDAKRYVDYREMLEKQKNIDAVLIATPDHLHAVIAMAAIKMGKHVYVEKPLTRTIYEARMLTEAAKKYKVASQMGNQGHAGLGNRQMCQWIWDGAIGEVREVHCWTNRPCWPSGVEMTRPKETPPVPDTLNWDLWLGPAQPRPYHPIYLPAVWRGWFDFGTGAVGDMACHIVDSPFWALKLSYPAEIVGSSDTYYSGYFRQDFEFMKDGFPRVSVIRFKFPAREGLPPVKLTWYDGGLMPERPEELEPQRRLGDANGGVLFVGSKGKIMCGCYGERPQLLPATRHQQYMEELKSRQVESIPPSPGHQVEWIEACKGAKPAGSNFNYSGPLTETIVMGMIALRFPNQVLQWDGANMKFVNNEKADAWIKPNYREGWSL